MAQTQLPVWIQYIQALGPSLVAVVAAGIAGYIAWRQWKTAHDRLRFDLFERRYAVYDATKNLISVARNQGKYLPNDISEYYEKIRGAEFLFDGDAKKVFTTVADLCRSAMIARTMLDEQPEHPRRGDLIESEKRVLLFFSAQDEDVLDKHFRPYLDLSKVRR